jgi:hypothetical protein
MDIALIHGLAMRWQMALSTLYHSLEILDFFYPYISGRMEKSQNPDYKTPLAIWNIFPHFRQENEKQS